jgi:hypothetical protein
MIAARAALASLAKVNPDTTPVVGKHPELCDASTGDEHAPNQIRAASAALLNLEIITSIPFFDSALLLYDRNIQNARNIQDARHREKVVDAIRTIYLPAVSIRPDAKANGDNADDQTQYELHCALHRSRHF